MKPTPLALLAAVLLPISSVFADVDVKTVVSDAVDNTFSGKNYTWTSSLPRPDGTAVAVTGQTDHDTTYVVMKDGTVTRTMLIVSGRRFILTDAGWKEAGKPQFHGGSDLPPPADAPPPRGGPESPEQRVRDAVSQVTTWTADGDTLTGQFTPKFPGFGPRGHADASAPASAGTATIALKITDGLLSTCTLAMTRTFTDASGQTVTHQHSITANFSAIGSTQVTVPAEVTTLLSAGK